MTMKRLLAVGLLLGAACTAQGATPIYRCGKTYSQEPCPGGHLIDAADPRSAAQRAEAARVLQREKKLADDLERDRLDREAGITPAQAAGFNGRPSPSQGTKPEPSKKKKKKAAKPKAASGADFVAIEPRKGAKKP